MNIGSYGIVRPSDVEIEDVLIYYSYSSNRGGGIKTFNKLDSESVISTVTLPSEDNNYILGGDNLMEGLYNLSLPADIFNELGYYNLYIKPITYKLNIVDCGIISENEEINGILINENDIPEKLRGNGGMIGFRVEYLDMTTNKKIRNLFRYVVSSNKVVISNNTTTTSSNQVRYSFSDDGNLIFLQLAPRVNSDYAFDYSYIGKNGQTILLSATYFDPIFMEIEVVKHDLNTIGEFLTGDQIRDVKNGLLTVYNSQKEIINQYNLFDIKDDVVDVPLFEVKQHVSEIDSSQEYGVVLDGFLDIELADGIEDEEETNNDQQTL